MGAARSCGGVKRAAETFRWERLSPGGWLSGQRPGSLVLNKPEVEQAAQVESGEAVVQPLVVLGDPAVADARGARQRKRRNVWPMRQSGY